ncbi:hypothetical protein [Acetobacter okinawensis]|uniref:hypothetical protein n=1 Tax=Acetobacter okinawensis TaxID=1076594 RepID=UPI00209EC6A9|nr:hypothetical protein [Acetobacter okinawensis]MCP1212381.1 hypothetical protein [Acetobacter okinawensis]
MAPRLPRTHGALPAHKPSALPACIRLHRACTLQRLYHVAHLVAGLRYTALNSAI